MPKKKHPELVEGCFFLNYLLFEDFFFLEDFLFLETFFFATFLFFAIFIFPTFRREIIINSDRKYFFKKYLRLSSLLYLIFRYTIEKK